MACQDNTAKQLVIVPAERLSPHALAGLIEEFVTRSGTDYGRREATLDEKSASVRRQLADGRARITYDTASQTCTIVLSDDVRHAGASGGQGKDVK